MLTKLDLMDKGTNALDVMRLPEFFLLSLYLSVSFYIFIHGHMIRIKFLNLDGDKCKDQLGSDMDFESFWKHTTCFLGFRLKHMRPWIIS